jgi:hypothetical protein
VQELWAIQTVIAQAEPGSKGSTGRHKRPMNDGASGLGCGKISAGIGAKDAPQERWTSTGSYRCPRAGAILRS